MQGVASCRVDRIYCITDRGYAMYTPVMVSVCVCLPFLAYLATLFDSECATVGRVSIDWEATGRRARREREVESCDVGLYNVEDRGVYFYEQKSSQGSGISKGREQQHRISLYVAISDLLFVYHVATNATKDHIGVLKDKKKLYNFFFRFLFCRQFVGLTCFIPCQREK